LSKKLKIISISVFSLLLAFAIGGAFFGYQLLKTPVSQDNTEVVFDVSPGLSAAQVARGLQSQNLIRNASVFLFYSRLMNQNSKIKVGEYSLNKAMTPDQILAVLVSGKSITRNLTVAEGLNIFEIGAILEKMGLGTKQEFLTIVHDKEFIKSLLNEDLNSLEGYLFPETYKFTKFENMKVIVTQMVKKFLVVWKEIEPLAEQKKWTRNQIVTFASIVEKETGAGFERPIVSSVFHNRMAKKMRLQTDPTIIYGMALKLGNIPLNITKNDLLTPTPYNTYTIAGLPPTPISNPGKEALLATLNPDSSNFLYFVSRNNGTHVFSETLEKHNAAVKAFQLNRQAREGKSWKDLEKVKPKNKSKK
jgi:UPF0755 protein